MPALVEVRDLSKVYGDGTVALHGLSFDVEQGEVFGLLGTNGAGKTTTMRILVTLLARTSGVARIAGFDVERDAEAVRRLIGYAAQAIAVDVDLTVRENLVMQARLQTMRRGPARRRADELLERFGLGEVANRLAGVLSGGMRRRLDLAQALVHDPTLVFLDEPTTGLDPQTRKALWDHLAEINRAGTTIVLSTQYLEEADRLCHRLAIVNHGQLVLLDSPAALKQEIGEEVVTVRLVHGVVDSDVERACGSLLSLPDVRGARSVDSSIVLPVKHAGRSLPRIVQVLDRLELGVEEVSVTTPTLEDVFLKHTGEHLPVEDLAGGAPRA